MRVCLLLTSASAQTLILQLLLTTLDKAAQRYLESFSFGRKVFFMEILPISQPRPMMATLGKYYIMLRRKAGYVYISCSKMHVNSFNWVSASEVTFWEIWESYLGRGLI